MTFLDLATERFSVRKFYDDYVAGKKELSEITANSSQKREPTNNDERHRYNEHVLAPPEEAL